MYDNFNLYHQLATAIERERGLTMYRIIGIFQGRAREIATENTLYAADATLTALIQAHNAQWIFFVETLKQGKGWVTL